MGFISDYTSNPLLRNYLKIFSVDVLVKASGFLLLPIYLMLMSQVEFGLYGYLLAIVSTFSLVFNLGIYAAQTKLFHDYPTERRGEVLFTLNVLLLAFMSLLFSLIFLFRLDFPLIAWLIKTPIDYAAYRMPVLLGVVTSVYAMLLVNYFLTSANIPTVQRFNLLRALFINALALIALWKLDGDHALLRMQYSVVAEFVLVIIFSVYYVRAMVARFNWEVARRAMAIGVPIMISAVIGIVINLSDRYFLEKYGTLEDLSLYNLALTLASVIPFVFASFQNLWLPEVLKEKDANKSRSQTRSMVIRIGILLIVISAGILVLLEVLLGMNWIDSKYAAAVPILPIVLGTAVLTSITGMYSNQLIYLEKLSVILVIGVLLAMLGIVLNQLLVPRWNIFGASIASFIINALFAIMYAVMVSFFHQRRMRHPAEGR